MMKKYGILVFIIIFIIIPFVNSECSPTKNENTNIITVKSQEIKTETIVKEEPMVLAKNEVNTKATEKKPVTDIKPQISTDAKAQAAKAATGSSFKPTLGLVNFMTGKAYYQLPKNEKKIYLVKGMKIPLNSTITTEASGRIEIKTPDNHFIRMWQKTVVSCFGMSVTNGRKIKSMEDLKNAKVVIKVQVGKIWNNLLKNSTAKRYEVTTPQGVCGVRGTIYSTSVEKSEDTDVYVFEGAVAVNKVDDNIKNNFQTTFGKSYRIPKPFHRIKKPYHQVTKEQWETVIKAMQHIHISSDGDRKVSDFSKVDIASDEFVKWNEERDTLIRQR
ncbi:FecR domain-containing protein [bacterium]|nr:FecR domain-containing protein [bacterium]